MTGTVLVAVGGNSLIRAGEKGTIAEQLANTRRTAEAIVQIIRLGFRVVVTHGNGPQVGAALIRSERAADQVYSHPLDVCDATTQGEIGYLLQQSLQVALAQAGLTTPVATIVTQVVVSATDPAMERPTKPIGPFYSAREAESKRRDLGWDIVEDTARGWRRVVPSPKPTAIVETDVIRQMAHAGYVVVACGGGGIPVIEEDNGDLCGVEAVIDKDLASSLLARSLGADALVLPTGVEKVALDFNKPTQRWLDEMTLAEAKRYSAEDQFDQGSMGPKVAALIDFVEGGGKLGLITDPPSLPRALRGETGTRVVA